jgi:hypothetical protein
VFRFTLPLAPHLAEHDQNMSNADRRRSITGAPSTTPGRLARS